MLGPSASLVIIVYGERHSYALGSKRPLSMIPGLLFTGSGIRKPWAPSALPSLCLFDNRLTVPKANKCSTELYIV